MKCASGGPRRYNNGTVYLSSRKGKHVRDCLLKSGSKATVIPAASVKCVRQSEGVTTGRTVNVSDPSSSRSDKRRSNDTSITFIRGAADRQHVSSLDGSPVADSAQAQDHHNDGCNTGVYASDELEVFQWSLDGIQKAQQADQVIQYVMDLLQSHQTKPSWETVALKSNDVKALWAQWPRLEIRNGLLKRRFESPDGLSVCWQIVWPSSLKTDFLHLAYGGVTGGPFGRRRSTASIQARVYWPSWSTDLDAFLRQREPCVRYSDADFTRHDPICSLDAEEPCGGISVRWMQGNTAYVSIFSRQRLGAAALSR